MGAWLVILGGKLLLLKARRVEVEDEDDEDGDEDVEGGMYVLLGGGGCGGDIELDDGV